MMELQVVLRKLPMGWEVVTLAESGLKNAYTATTDLVMQIFLQDGSAFFTVLRDASLPKGWKQLTQNLGEIKRGRYL